MANEILTPPGRIVQAVIFEGIKTNQMNQPLVGKNGQPYEEYYFNLAVPKTDPDWNRFWTELGQIAVAEFPRGEYTQGDFNWKVKDGDQKADKEGFAGHWIICCKTRRMVPAYKAQGAGGQFVQLTSRDQIKAGDYARVSIYVKGNDTPGRLGLYLNHQMIEHLGYGEPIHTGPNPGDVFNQPAALPPGASATPVAGAVPPMAGQPVAAPALPAVGQQPVTAPQAAPALPAVGQPMAAPAIPLPMRSLLSPSVSRPGLPL